MIAILLSLVNLRMNIVGAYLKRGKYVAEEKLRSSEEGATPGNIVLVEGNIGIGKTTLCPGQLLKQGLDWRWFFAPFSLLLYGRLIQGLKFSVWGGTESYNLPVKPCIKGIKYTVYGTHNLSCTVYMCHYEGFIAAT